MSIELHNGDCLAKMATIESGSVDAIICDPPYGTVRGLFDGKTQWDTVIDHTAMLDECNRILRPNGALVLFGQDPYTARLMTDTHGNLPFSYRYTWRKDTFANHLGCKKAPVNYTEDVCVFFKRNPKNGCRPNPIREYFKGEREKINETLTTINRVAFGDTKGKDGMAGNILSSYKKGWTFPTEDKYNKLREAYGVCRADYAILKAESDGYQNALLVEINAEYPRTFNLPQGAKYKSNVLEYRKDYRGEHPTQKPVALMDDLVYTYTNHADTVLDFTMGSGTTGVACANLGRSFIGIERDEGYFATAAKRIGEVQCPADEPQQEFEL